MNLTSAEKQIAHYKFNLHNKIGHGSYGIVYKGLNLNNNQQVALKVIDKKTLANQAIWQLIQQEIQIMKSLNQNNPNVVNLIDVFTTTNNIYIVSEFCNGGDLKEYIAFRKKVPEQEAVYILKNILNGLKELFSHSIIHRDIKPANIIKHDNIFKVTDFGFARKIDLQNELMNSLVGTPLYMSPQVLLKQCYTSKCDIWSIGLIFYELIFGVTPWPSRDIIELLNNIEHYPIKTILQKSIQNIQISKNAYDFILGCLQVEESSRFTWKQLYKHPLFENYFIDQIKIQENTLNEIVDQKSIDPCRIIQTEEYSTSQNKCELQHINRPSIVEIKNQIKDKNQSIKLENKKSKKVSIATQENKENINPNYNFQEKSSKSLHQRIETMDKFTLQKQYKTSNNLSINQQEKFIKSSNQLSIHQTIPSFGLEQKLISQKGSSNQTLLLINDKHNSRSASPLNVLKSKNTSKRNSSGNKIRDSLKNSNKQEFENLTRKRESCLQYEGQNTAIVTDFDLNIQNDNEHLSHLGSDRNNMAMNDTIERVGKVMNFIEVLYNLHQQMKIYIINNNDLNNENKNFEFASNQIMNIASILNQHLINLYHTNDNFIGLSDFHQISSQYQHLHEKLMNYQQKINSSFDIDSHQLQIQVIHTLSNSLHPFIHSNWQILKDFISSKLSALNTISLDDLDKLFISSTQYPRLQFLYYVLSISIEIQQLKQNYKNWTQQLINIPHHQKPHKMILAIKSKINLVPNN